MNKIVGKDAARALVDAWSGDGKGHFIGYFKNVSGDFTFFECVGNNVAFVQRRPTIDEIEDKIKKLSEELDKV